MITVDGGALSIEAVVRAAREHEAVALDPGVRARMRPAREVVDRLDREGAIVYGVTTGFGALADRPSTGPIAPSCSDRWCSATPPDPVPGWTMRWSAG